MMVSPLFSTTPLPCRPTILHVGYHNMMSSLLLRPTRCRYHADHHDITSSILLKPVRGRYHADHHDYDMTSSIWPAKGRYHACHHGMKLGDAGAAGLVVTSAKTTNSNDSTRW